MAATQMRLFVAFVFMIRLAVALQVTPNSPCAALCLDSEDLDKSDPNSSSTKGSDITCDDDLFSTTKKGQKIQNCLTCLQESNFVQGSESDQKWFLYNMRYSVNYCILGFPNNTEVGSNPCITSEACGPLADSLQSGILKPSGKNPYDYCDAEGQGSLGYAYEKCQSCIHAAGTHHYLSNFLTALEAGCRQRPDSGVILGLNDTVFSTSNIGIVDPKTPGDANDKSGIQLSTPIVAAIAVGAAVLVIAIAGCVYLRIRKRKNRVSRLRRRRASPLSFQCQTHLTPRDPHFQFGIDPSVHEKPYIDPSAALSSNPINGPSPWMSPRATDFSDDKHDGKFPNITVTTCLPTPPIVHTSPQRASPDDYMSPQSATSTRSNVPLLHHKPYVPSEYAGSPQQQSVASFSPIISTPISQRGSPSPIQSESCWEDQRVMGSGRNLTGKNNPWAPSSNFEAKVFSTSFPPPPKR